MQFLDFWLIFVAKFCRRDLRTFSADFFILKKESADFFTFRMYGLETYFWQKLFLADQILQSQEKCGRVDEGLGGAGADFVQHGIVNWQYF